MASRDCVYSEPGYLLAADVLRMLAPDELDDLPSVWEDYLRDPTEPGDLESDDRLLGSGLAREFVEWAPLIVAFLGKEVLVGAVVDAAKERLRRQTARARRWLRAWRHRGVPVAIVTVRNLTTEQILAVQSEAEKTAVALGRSTGEAKAFGDAVAGALIRAGRSADGTLASGDVAGRATLVDAGASADRVFLLPPPSASRFTLAQLTLGAAAVFASSWFLVFRPGPSSVATAACAGSAVSTERYLACTSAAFVREAFLVLAGPAVLALMAILGWLLAPYGLAWWWSVRPLPDGPVRVALNELAREVGTERFPQWCMAPGSDAWTYGRWPRYRVVLGHDLVRGIRRRGIGPARAAVTHELAHLRNRDVDRTYATLCAFVVFTVLIAIPLAADAIVQGLGLGLSLGWRLAVVVAVTLFTSAAVLRSREHDADLRAASSCPDAMICALTVSAARRDRIRFRRPHPLRVHPAEAERLAVVEDPSRVMRISGAECLAAGVAAGVVLVELPSVVQGLLEGGPGGPITAYLVAGWLVGLPLTRVVGLSAWRAALDAACSPGGRRLRVFLPGVALGVGLLVGSQISPRASAAWQAVFGSASEREFSPALQSVAPSALAWLVALVLMTSVLFVAWSTAMGAAFMNAHRRVALRTVVLLVETTVLALPLGGWFLTLRLAASSGADAPALADMLAGRHAVLALAVTVLIATLCLLISRSRPRRPHIILGALGAAMLVTAVAAPATLSLFPGRALPGVAPPTASVAFPSSRQAGTTCLWLHTIGSVGTAGDADYQRRLGRYLAGTDDELMRHIGSELVTSSTDPGGPVAASARTALIRRCDELRAFGH